MELSPALQTLLSLLSWTSIFTFLNFTVCKIWKMLSSHNSIVAFKPGNVGSAAL